MAGLMAALMVVSGGGDRVGRVAEGTSSVRKEEWRIEMNELAMGWLGNSGRYMGGLNDVLVFKMLSSTRPGLSTDSFTIPAHFSLSRVADTRRTDIIQMTAHNLITLIKKGTYFLQLVFLNLDL